MKVINIYIEEMSKLFDKLMQGEYLVQCQLLHKCKMWSDNRINAQSVLLHHGINKCWRHPFSDLQVGQTSVLGNLFQREKLQILGVPVHSTQAVVIIWNHHLLMKTSDFQRLKDSWKSGGQCKSDEATAGARAAREQGPACFCTVILVLSL